MAPHSHLLIGLALLLSSGSAPAQAPPPPDSTKGRWNVTLETSSLDNLLLRPEEILGDPDRFWETDAAYTFVKGWHESNKIPMDTKDYYNRWLEFLKTRAAVPESERMNHPAFRLLRELQERIPRFQDKSIRLLDEFIPRNMLTFETTIYLTAMTFPYAMMHDGKIMADVLSRHFDNDPDKIFNLLTHECFHIGYGYNRYLRREAELDNYFLYNTMLDALQNEGMATYLGFQAQEFFPAKGLKDYQMLEDPSEVRRLLAEVNRLFATAERVPPDSLRTLSWETGVNQRAYYVTGAHMARTIDQRLGREALVETIEAGPRQFVDRYNGLVEEPMRVAAFGAPDPPSALQRLRSAVLDEDRLAFDSVKAEIESGTGELVPEAQRRIERMGYGMALQKKYDWAIAIYEFDISLFPESVDGHDGLAEACMKTGDSAGAIRHYKRVLEIDPSMDRARMMLKELGAVD